MNDITILYSTWQNEVAAKDAAQKLVEQHLAACCNIIPAVTSIYKWEGKAEESQESVMLIKTTKNQLDKLMKAVLEMHEYDCPALFEIELGQCSAPFADWIRSQTQI
ncbi:MAG: divalent-cation tolerance protein CutA [Rickettsiales bacterium]|nr:divalent-cation tolerance protein CutA [Rickettsiales bacterium]